VDKRPFAPHLTLARIKAPLQAEELQQLQHLLTGAQQDFIVREDYLVEHVNVMKSELLRTGARYSSLQSYRLGGEKKMVTIGE
jgi:2'-5' RNA ligase